MSRYTVTSQTNRAQHISNRNITKTDKPLPRQRNHCHCLFTVYRPPGQSAADTDPWLGSFAAAVGALTGPHCRLLRGHQYGPLGTGRGRRCPVLEAAQFLDLNTFRSPTHKLRNIDIAFSSAIGSTLTLSPTCPARCGEWSLRHRPPSQHDQVLATRPCPLAFPAQSPLQPHLPLRVSCPPHRGRPLSAQRLHAASFWFRIPT